jgi:hypothetical protein
MRTQNNPFRLTATVAVAGLLLAQMLPGSVLAQPAPPPGAQDQQTGDPPVRVGRLARVSGTVSFHTQDDNQWTPATLNYPVTSGNAFWTEPNAQAEIEVSASRIAMAPGTELDIASLTDTALQATEPQGEVYLRLRSAAPDETYAVQTPRGVVALASPGRYEVAAGDTDNPTRITVVEGSAQVTGPGLTLDVGPHQTAMISGTDTFQGQVGPEQPDPFLTAMLDRERPPPQQAVAPPPAVIAMPGGEDLANYGTWSDSPDYGQVWYPQVAPGWVPYREGHWAYVGPWGWTWVDSAPWGFAPFHYGRWAEFGGRWGWVPGGRERFPVYAPALVTFVGIGAIAGVGIGAALAEGRIGWLPLGPREPFHPWYRASDRYFRQVNINHVTNITTINRNVTINNFVNRGAATVVPTSAMTGSRPVAPIAQRINPAQLAQAHPVIGQQPLRPAPTTAGVTPAVARQLNLPVTGALHPNAPGPAIRPMPAAVSPGAVIRAPAEHAGTPLLHNPAPPSVPAAAGTRPFTGTPGGVAGPALRAPVTPGHVGPPPIQHQPFVASPGAVPASPSGPMVSAPSVVHPGGQSIPAAISNPAPQVHAPPQVHTPPPAAIHPPPVAGAPPVVAHSPPISAPPPPVHTPPPVVHAAPAPAQPQFHAPVVQAPPPVVHAPPPVAHVAAPPPPVVHAAPPPPVVHAAPAPAPHAAPPPPQSGGQHKRPGEP